MQEKDGKKDQDIRLTSPNPTIGTQKQTKSVEETLDQMAEKESKKQSALIQSEEMDKILEAYRQHCKNKTPPKEIKEDDLKADKDGKVNLQFDSPEDMTSFFKQQAEEKQRFIMIDAQTNKVIAYSNGDGQLWRPGKNGGPPENITDKPSLVPTESEMKDLPDHDKFTMPEPSTAPQLK